MKILYSQLKQFVPGLKATPKQIGEKFTMAGLMTASLKKVIYLGRSDFLFDLEVRQNRVDCLSVWGLAREVAAYYGLKVKLPTVKIKVFAKSDSGIKVRIPKKVIRALAININNVRNEKSPTWLKELMGFYDINPINLLVDLSNYVMILTGFSSHILDRDKMSGSLAWKMNDGFKTITTLDGTLINLRGDEIILADDKNILGLAGMVGGQIAAIQEETKNITIEMAIYDRVLVRRNSRSLKVFTEASNRLEKDQDSNGLDFAMNLLLSLILEKTGGRISSKLFSYYPKKIVRPKIDFNPVSPSVFAGVKISGTQALNILKRLDFQVVKKSVSLWHVRPPVSRMDVTIPEDVIEEVIRIFGFEKIPTNDAPVFAIAKQMTSNIVKLSEKSRDILSIIGFDEILSWPLTKKEINSETNYLDWENISTQNSVNEEFPDLRQSIAPSLLFQLKEYKKRNIGKIKLFEIGKVFGKKGSNYFEQESLGILIESGVSGISKKVISELKNTADTLLLSLGFNEISYLSSVIKPKISNPFSCWDIKIREKTVGIIYKIDKSVGFAEINISKISELINSFNLNPVVELVHKLVVLDANIELDNSKDINFLLKNLQKEIGKNLWSFELIDIFSLKEKNSTRYTIKVSYIGLSDKEAKAIHSKIFNLS